MRCRNFRSAALVRRAGREGVAITFVVLAVSGLVMAFGKFILLPVIIGVIGGVGGSVRWYRTIFLEEITRDYVRTARAKGLPEASLLARHALPLDAPARGGNSWHCLAGIAQGFVNSSSKPCRISGRNEQPVLTVFDQIRHASHVGGNDGRFQRHGFQDDIGRTLVIRRLHE